MPPTSPQSSRVVDTLIGKKFAGRYEIEALIGKGGMASVYRARQYPIDRAVALKVIGGDVDGESETVKRFHREMRATAKINHPNTIQVFDFGHSDEGQLFLAMELLVGRSLAKVIAEDGALPPARVVPIGIQIIAALAAAHSEKIVHRDLKPENILLVDRYEKKDLVKVLDFGIARFYGDAGGADSDRVTATGFLVGTPKYMAPEQSDPKNPIDARSDLYSFGVLLYHLCTGKLPFNYKTTLEVLEAHLTELPKPPSEVGPHALPPALEALVLKLLEKDPANRPQSAELVLAELKSLVRTLPEHVYQGTPGPGAAIVPAALPRAAVARPVAAEAPGGFANRLEPEPGGASGITDPGSVDYSQFAGRTDRAAGGGATREEPVEREAEAEAPAELPASSGPPAAVIWAVFGVALVGLLWLAYSTFFAQAPPVP